MLRQLSAISPTTVGLVLLLVVLATATLSRLWIAIVVALGATAAFNFFFFPPVGTFTIAEFENWVALLAFLAAAVIASSLTAVGQARAREAIARRNAELAATLLASLSHDLKTPLTAIRVAVENLRDDLAAADRRAQANAAIAELDRLNRLFHDILEMARIDAATIDLERQWVTPADVVDAALAHVRHTVDAKAIRVAADSATEVEIDPRVASVALSHLLQNAAQYSPPGRDIVIDADARDDGLHISVTDHGAGLDPDEIAYLFDRFYRGRRARKQGAGTGMGLAITRGLLGAVGGRVSAENVPPAGARFTIVIPGATRPVSAAAV